MSSAPRSAPGRLEPGSALEGGVLLALALALVLAYVAAGFFPAALLAALEGLGIALPAELPTRYERLLAGGLSAAPPQGLLWGLDRWKHAGALGGVLLPVLLVGLALAARGGLLDGLAARASAWLAVSRLRALGCGAAAAVVFFALRSEWVNPDGQLFAQKFRETVPVQGWFATHDELWELYLHSRFWALTERLFGWSVELSYQVASAAAGGAFVALLVRYALLLQPARAAPFVLCVAAGGYAQLFFGDVENYTLTAVCVLLYLHAAALHVRRGLALVWPAAALGLCLSFHLLTVFLCPSLVWLCVRELRSGRVAAALRAGLACALVFGATLLFFHLQGLPVQALWTESHATAKGGNVSNYLADPSFEHYWHQTQLLLLLAPCVVLLPALAAFRRISGDSVDVHLAVATGSMLAFHFAIKGFLGIYYDWNLFANVALPLSVLVWNAALGRPVSTSGKVALTVLAAAAALHSLAWIAANHAFEPFVP